MFLNHTGGIEVWRDFISIDSQEHLEKESRGQILVSLSRDPDKKSLSLNLVKGKDIEIQHGTVGCVWNFQIGRGCKLAIFLI